MKKIILSLTAGLLLGGASVYAWLEMRDRAGADADFAAALQKKDQDLEKLKASLAEAKSSADNLRQRFDAAGLDDDPVRENELDIQRLLNDARPLMKSLALMFGEQRKLMTEKWIRGMAEKLAQEMGLTEEQTADMIAHFLKLDEENFAKIKAMLDRKLTILDVFSVMKEMNPQKSMDDYVMTAMTDEQKKSWENRKLESKAQQLERTANWQLDRMSKSLNLDEAQKDQVFDILVKKSPQYDPALAVEGVNAGVELDTQKSQDEAIAEVLRPEQMEDWNKLQERQQNEKKRWSDALGGFDPAQLLQGMGGGMGFGGGFGGRRGR